MEADLNEQAAYHRWYYDNGIYNRRYLGVPITKFVTDLWNYQEILVDLRPGLVVEFGTQNGGSALYFAELMRTINPDGLVLTVDIVDGCPPIVKEHPLICFLLSDSVSPAVATEIRSLRELHPGPVFAILDSDHYKAHVLAEMELLRDILVEGDYLVVEDGNINGHPVYPTWGPGPWEAIGEYRERYPDDYRRDRDTEVKFGFTAAPGGFLVRC